MRKVLAAVDNSAAARPVLAAAKEIARLFDTGLEAVHVREDSKRTAAGVAERAGVTLRELEADDVVDGLLEAGRPRAVAAVVVGARGARTGRRPAGHVALDLIVELRKPVVVVPPSTPTPFALERILVPLDATRETAAALAPTVELACQCGIDVVALHVHDERSLPLFSNHVGHEVEAWSREFLARYCPHAEQARLEVRVGDPGEHLAAVAAEIEASMIALGWAQDLSPGRAEVVREALARSSVPVLLAPAAGPVTRTARPARVPAQARG